MTHHSSYQLSSSFGYLSHPEINLLKTFVKNLSSNAIVVNIGAGSGTSHLAMREARANVDIYTIDIVDGASPFGCLEAARNVLGGLRSEKDHFIHADSKAYNWNHGEIEFVFIDGDHSIEGVRGDFENFEKHLSPKGYIAFHDYDKQHSDSFKDDAKMWDDVTLFVDNLEGWKIVARVDSIAIVRKA